MALTKRQLEWLETRTKAIIETQVNKFKDTLPELPTLGFRDKLAAIRAGKAKLKPDGELNMWTDLGDAYTYPTFTPIQKKKDEREAMIAKYRRTLEAVQEKVMDNAILGDAKEALAALESFTAQIAKTKA